MGRSCHAVTDCHHWTTSNFNLCTTVQVHTRATSPLANNQLPPSCISTSTKRQASGINRRRKISQPIIGVDELMRKMPAKGTIRIHDLSFGQYRVWSLCNNAQHMATSCVASSPVNAQNCSELSLGQLPRMELVASATATFMIRGAFCYPNHCVEETVLYLVLQMGQDLPYFRILGYVGFLYQILY